jgi:hypothetical protein
MWCGVSFFFVCMVCRGQKTDVQLCHFFVCLFVCFFVCAPTLILAQAKKNWSNTSIALIHMVVK